MTENRYPILKSLAVLAALGGVPVATAQQIHTPPSAQRTSEYNFSNGENSEQRRLKYDAFLGRFKKLQTHTLTLGAEMPTSIIPFGYQEICTKAFERFKDLCDKHGKKDSQTPHLNEYSYFMLRSINSFFNKNIKPVSDKNKFNREEVWEILNFLVSGDCEEYVKVKYHWIKEFKFPTSSLSLGLVRVKDTGEGHLVLFHREIVDGKEVTFVLDNLTEEMLLVTEATHLEFIGATDQGNKWRLVSGFN